MSRSTIPPSLTLPRKGGGEFLLTPPLPLREGAGGGGRVEQDYLRDPAAIYRESFATIRRESRLDRFPDEVADMVVRLIHACGMTEIAGDIAFTPDVARAARVALRNGGAVLCDSRMVAAGIMRRRLPAKNDVICALGNPRVPALAKRLATTRSAAAVELWRDRIDGAIVVIGNAPTALFHLLGRLERDWPKPAAILAFPVGFVGAAESKDALIASSSGVPYITLCGRRGGSAMAAAAVNALIIPESGSAA